MNPADVWERAYARDQAIQRAARVRAETRARRLERRLDALTATRCVYCGELCHGLACADHRGLLRVDPHYEGTG